VVTGPDQPGDVEEAPIEFSALHQALGVVRDDVHTAALALDSEPDVTAAPGRFHRESDPEYRG